MDFDDQLQAELAALDVQSRQLVLEADLGRQAKEFFESPLGKYVLGCISQEIMAAQLELTDANWWSFWKVRKLQNQIWRARSMIGWLADLVRQGKHAEAALVEGEGNG